MFWTQGSVWVMYNPYRMAASPAKDDVARSNVMGGLLVYRNFVNKVLCERSSSDEIDSVVGSNAHEIVLIPNNAIGAGGRVMLQSSSSSSSRLLWSWVIPLALPAALIIRLVVIGALLGKESSTTTDDAASATSTTTPAALSSSILAYLVMGFFGYLATVRLVPHIQQYTLRKGIFGKDLGKRGTATADVPM
jgi:hypothetical protein